MINQAHAYYQIPTDPNISPKPKKCMNPNGIHGLKQRNPWPNLQSNTTEPKIQTKQAPSSSHTPTDLETYPKTLKCTSPNEINGTKQEDPWQISKNTHYSPPILINQAPAFSQNPPYPESPPKTKIYRSPYRSHSLNQGNPWQNIQSNPTPPSNQPKQAPPSYHTSTEPKTPPQTSKSTIPNDIHAPKQGYL